MFIQTEDTPNPDAVKFFPGVEISPNSPMFFSDITEVKNQSKLAELLFAIKGVKSVFFGSDFVTLTKSAKSDWTIIKPEILMVIMDYFVAGHPVFEKETSPSLKMDDTNLSEIEKQIIEIIETRVRPSVAMDGGDIVYRGFQDGIVKLELRGACAGCPSSTITLRHGIESMLQHFIPEVIAVEAVEDDQ